MIDFYLSATNRLNIVFENIKKNKIPPKVTYKYINDNLCCSNNSYNRDYQKLLKNLNMIDSNNVPTKHYHQYVSSQNCKSILAERIKYAYRDIFSIYPNAYTFDKDKIKELIRIKSGNTIDEKMLKKIVATFFALCTLAESELDIKSQLIKKDRTVDFKDIEKLADKNNIELDLEVKITFPDTKDVEVHKAIFKAYKDIFENKTNQQSTKHND